MDDGIHDLPTLGEEEAKTFDIKNEAERVIAKQSLLLPKLEALLGGTIAVIESVYESDPLVDSTIARRPAFRASTKRPADYGNVFAGLAPKRTRVEKGYAKPDGTPAKLGYVHLILELSDRGLLAALEVTRPPEARMLFGLLKEHAEAVTEYLERHGLLVWTGDSPEGFSDADGLAQTVVPTDRQWWPCGIGGSLFPYPVGAEEQWASVIDFVAIFPFYTAMVDRFFGRQERLISYMQTCDNYVDDELDRDSQQTPAIESSERHSRPADGLSGDEAWSLQPDPLLGRRGEEHVIAYEKTRLTDRGRPDLADRVVHVSVEEGDGAGYDIRSFDEEGNTIYIEVKTTNGPKEAPFILTANELRFSESHANRYYCYRLFGFAKSRQLIIRRGSLRDSCRLEPTHYRASF